jgi:hypothetical protein
VVKEGQKPKEQRRKGKKEKKKKRWEKKEMEPQKGLGNVLHSPPSPYIPQVWGPGRLSGHDHPERSSFDYLILSIPDPVA